MIKPILSTYKILKDKVFDFDIDESWIEWAVEMMQAGFQVESLYQLAGISKPFNQFELQELTNSVLQDLKLEFTDKEKVVRDYVYHIISNAVDNPKLYIETLREINNIYIDLNMEQEYTQFHLLYFAKSDLLETENQWYWDGANQTNIDMIIKEQFDIWKMKFELNRKPFQN